MLGLKGLRPRNIPQSLPDMPVLEVQLCAQMDVHDDRGILFLGCDG